MVLSRPRRVAGICSTKVPCDEPIDDEEDGIERALRSDSYFALSSEEEEDEESDSDCEARPQVSTPTDTIRFVLRFDMHHSVNHVN